MCSAAVSSLRDASVVLRSCWHGWFVFSVAAEGETSSYAVQQSAACEKLLMGSAVSDDESETPSHPMQQSAACEKPSVDDAVAFASGSSVSSDDESETLSQTMQQ